MTSISTIVIGPDGRVIAVGGDLPDGLADRLLADCVELPIPVRDAGARLVAERDTAGPGPRARIVGLGDSTGIAVIVLEAVAIRREATDLRTLLASRLSSLSRQAEEAGVRLQIDVAADVPQAFIDGEKIAWAVSTLVGNALRYVPPSRWLGGSMIMVAATSQPASSELTIEVSDTGPGIPAADAARLLERTPATPGRGLALLLIRDIVAAHGGRMAVVSSTESGRHGTTFRLTLPMR
jgi:signal transduction histidine kinase